EQGLAVGELLRADLVRPRRRALDDVGEPHAVGERQVVFPAWLIRQQAGRTQSAIELLAELALVVVAGGDATGRGIDSEADNRQTRSQQVLKSLDFFVQPLFADAVAHSGAPPVDGGSRVHNLTV